MPGELLSTAPRIALFGKLPAHGDFVRRGNLPLVQRLDAWLTAGIMRLAAEEEPLDERLSALPAWCFRLQAGIAGAIVASHDKVGRVHPLIACAGKRTSPDAIAAAMVTARDNAGSADTLYAALSTIAAETPADRTESEGERTGWWRIGEDPDPAVSGQDLPQDEDFLRLFGGEPASCPA